MWDEEAQSTKEQRYLRTKELKYLKLDGCCLTSILNGLEKVEEGSGGVFAFDSREIEIDSTANFVAG